jgi:hypothetical protein
MREINTIQTYHTFTFIIKGSASHKRGGPLAARSFLKNIQYCVDVQPALHPGRQEPSANTSPAEAHLFFCLAYLSYSPRAS